MVQPLNYMMAVADPMQRTLEGYRSGIDATTALAQRQAMQEQAAREQEMQPIRVQQAQQDIAMNAQTMGIRTAEEARRAQAFAQQQADAERQRQRQEAFRGALGGLIAKGMSATVDDVASVIGQFPELAGETQAIYSSLSVERQKPLVRSIAQAAVALKSGDAETAKKVANDFASAAEASGDMSLAAQARAVSQMIDVDPNVAFAQAAILLQSMDKDISKAVLGEGGTKVQRSIPVGDGSVTALIMSDGSTRYQDTATGEVLSEGDARLDAARSGEIEQGAAKVAATERAKVVGRAAAEAQVSAPGDLAEAQRAIDLVKSVRDSEYLAGITGRFQGRLPEYALTQGGQDLLAKIKQIEGKAFLQAFESLKGGGQITEVEGKKATQAIARLERAQSTEAYRDALNELIATIEPIYKRNAKIASEANSASGQASAVSRIREISAKIASDPNYVPTDEEMGILEGAAK